MLETTHMIGPVDRTEPVQVPGPDDTLSAIGAARDVAAEPNPAEPDPEDGTTAYGQLGAPLAHAEGDLRVDLKLDLDGAVVTSETVTRADMIDLYGEIWWLSQLRRGHPEVTLDDTEIQVRPLYLKDEAPVCRGIVLQATNPSGQTSVRYFGRRTLAHVADRASRRLLQGGVLKALDTYYYELHADGAAAGVSGPPDLTGVISAGSGGTRPAVALSTTTAPLRHLVQPLRPLLDAGQAVGETLPGAHQVFYTRAALDKAEQIARRGESERPPVETGGVLIGPLCSCPETGEMYGVIDDVLEAVDAEQGVASLSFSGRTWSQIATVMRARRTVAGREADRILGQTHGHNFLPHSGSSRCESCDRVRTCDLTSAFLSESDRTWCRAVFSGQPWQVSHIFGLSARHERVASFYGLHRGRLEPRGYRVIERFERPGR
ncbi:MAG: hypothetical protein PVF43_06970 [Candidatus Eiseniibacteriota bacterium]|jgi:hypothetical protein